jgi:pyrimidine-specific ribonucleoside hydrolase
MNKTHYIIDCDPGHDDVMAILTAAANELDVAGICTVAGNNLVERVSENIFNVLSLFDIRIPIHVGADKALKYPAIPQDAHGYNGLEGPIFEPKQPVYAKESADQFYKQILDKEKVVIFALGPLTNIANIILNGYNISNIEAIYLMGGSRDSSYHEFNIYADPHAAKIVMESGIKTYIADFSICLDLATPFVAMEQFHKPDKLNECIYLIIEYFSRYSIEHGQKGFPLFDLTAVMAHLYPELFEFKPIKVDVKVEDDEYRGQTIMSDDPDSPVYLIEKCLSNDEYQSLWQDAINKLVSSKNT